MKKNEFLILSHLRQNARRNLSKISKHTGIPVSTIFDRLKVYEKDIIKKHTSLLDFTKMGYDVWVKLIVKVKNKEEAQSYLMKNFSVNSFYRINNGYDFLVEAVFKGVRDYHLFSEKLESFGLQKKHEFFVLQELRREEFLNSSEFLDLYPA